jgi:hypothetical protein
VGLQDEQISLVHVTRRKWFLDPFSSCAAS